ncbi:hypothetical protein B7494_g4325 [Chlorociboria aeruginascens]|nr:hypothetical protein B7494_g4325 [Chlorociboria aeruginascens]
MAPQKRSRYEADDEVITVESASSSFRAQDSSIHKKARISMNGEPSNRQNVKERSPSTSSSDEDMSDAKPDEAAPPPSTQYEILRDGNFEHLQNPDLDDQIATQRFLARKQQIGDNLPAENAILEEITCINFMCHEKLHVELGPLINFVVGMNGSGKSAVLTAITLCLGGKASATNRGASLKSLIKEGKDRAVLMVRLKNGGPDAYQPDVYGKSIIVERHFAKAGGSSYKLKNAAGRSISTKKADVDDIVEYFQLQVDNPMNVLTQDAAKTFITASTAKMKYDFFVKGVQLDQLDNDYRLVSDTCDAIEIKLRESKEDIAGLERAYEAAKDKAKIVVEHDGMRKRVRELGRQAAWAQVEDEESRLAERDKALQVLNEKIGNAEESVRDQRDLYERMDNTLKEAEQSKCQHIEELLPLKQEEQEVRDTDTIAKNNVKEAHTEQRKIKTSLTDAQKKVERIQGEINAEVRRMENANGGAQARKLAEIEEAKDRVEEFKAAFEQSQTEGPRLEKDQIMAYEDFRKADEPLNAKRKEIEAAQSKLSMMTSDRGDVMAGFDPKILRLLQMIRNDSEFREKPVGPIGLHIKLKKQAWSEILEKTFGMTLNGFIVTSKMDQVKLSAMIKSLHLEFCPVFIGNKHSLDTTGREPDPQYDTIMRLLDIDNDLVRSQLILNQAIEQSLLIENRDDALRIMFQGAKPVNVKQCFTINTHKRGWGIRYSHSGRQNQNQSMDSISPTNRKPRMKTDIESQIAYQKETVKHLEQEARNLENHRHQLQQASQRANQILTEHKRSHAILRVDMQRAEDRLERLEVDLEKENVEVGRLEGLRVDLTDAQNDVNMYGDTYGNNGVQKEKLNEVAAERNRALAEVKARVADHEAKIRKAEIKVRNITAARQEKLRDLNAAIQIVDDLKETVVTAQRKREDQNIRVQEFIGHATDVCQRVPVDEGETPTSLDVKLSKLRDQIKAYNRKVGGTDEEIFAAAEEAQRVYEDATKHSRHLHDLLALLKQSFMMRVKQFRQFQKLISARSRINFNYLLSERAFRGKLTIDHKAKQLEVHVEPDETTRNGKGRQTKTLSGGEKSFSSICLLLALWEAMNAPLRCLDEFDVFMDDVNRDVSTKMIISAARRAVGKQFILITPKALGAGVGTADDVRIIKLKDPRDNQMRIDEMV